MKAEIGSEWRDGLPFFGGSLWLDFINTTPIVNGKALDFLKDPKGLRRWMAAAHIGDAPPLAPDDHESALTMRRTLRTAAKRLMTGAPLSSPMLAAINAALSTISVQHRLVATGSSLALNEMTNIDGARITAIVARDFARFVCDFESARLHHCANPACVMVFYDLGRNNTRRWCTMAICGNRNKVAHYRARRAEKS